MDLRDWITISVALATLVSSWGQFWVKERLFNPSIPSADPVLEAVRSKAGIAIFGVTGLTSAAAIWLLVMEIQSDAPLTRMAVFAISVLTVLAVLNIVLVHGAYVLRRLARIKKTVDEASKTAQRALYLGL